MKHRRFRIFFGAYDHTNSKFIRDTPYITLYELGVFGWEWFGIRRQDNYKRI